jgi:hypothetical protein
VGGRRGFSACMHFRWFGATYTQPRKQRLPQVWRTGGAGVVGVLAVQALVAAAVAAHAAALAPPVQGVLGGAALSLGCRAAGHVPADGDAGEAVGGQALLVPSALPEAGGAGGAGPAGERAVHAGVLLAAAALAAALVPEAQLQGPGDACTRQPRWQAQGRHMAATPICSLHAPARGTSAASGGSCRPKAPTCRCQQDGCCHQPPHRSLRPQRVIAADWPPHDDCGRWPTLATPGCPGCYRAGKELASCP